MMTREAAAGIALVFVLGFGAQWLAWRLRVPSILLLLSVGIASGPPLTGLIDPDAIFGASLVPIVSLSVALILFEGALSLRFSEITGLRAAVFTLILTGVFVAFPLIVWGAVHIAHLPEGVAMLLGAILIVTGPTVIIPLLRDIRPCPPLGSLLKWEGILIDPVGAILSVLVFEAFLHGPGGVVGGIGKTAALAAVIGAAGALLIRGSIRRRLVPDYLENHFVLAVCLFGFALSNHLQPESGLASVTVMGVILANMPGMAVRHILEFKENLATLLLSMLFILLGARLSPAGMEQLGLHSLIFLAFLVVVVRPAAAIIATIRSGLRWRERLFIAGVAPRGIVAAAVSSVFAFELSRAGIEGAELLVPYTFLVIIGSDFVYGLSAPYLASFLRVAQKSPQGLLIMGANSVARAIGRALREAGFDVLLVDTNQHNVSLAQAEDLPATQGNLLSETVIDSLNMEGLGKLLALTPNEEANALAALRFAEIFGRSNVYQLIPETGEGEGGFARAALHLRGRFLFGPQAHYEDLGRRLKRGGVLRRFSVTAGFGLPELIRQFRGQIMPLFLISSSGHLRVFLAREQGSAQAGDAVIALVPGGSESLAP